MWYLDIGLNNGLNLITSPYENDPRKQKSLKAQFQLVLQQKHQNDIVFQHSKPQQPQL